MGCGDLTEVERLLEGAASSADRRDSCGRALRTVLESLLEELFWHHLRSARLQQQIEMLATSMQPRGWRCKKK